ncbi:hypothetical protein CMQ_7331 [Grosmannia clavigera kw1407]|uniref:Uncharacterized protein n=1 Tax=Grosmannia clavigera (strain kw1407 / UAMH 11150) TaxID=655863 RepID=F0XNU7_GROCL|nr:uncharacterized protein CMQ_7331 [Grosmannia clavigera kw1407]EFX00329.1 hypothetical protein CMQ_7331 [Grosmannia clavigera kw1407]
MEDEGNYRTVSWQGSVVRSETVKIVRRWMEEDSFTGKPVLGLSGTRGNLFGWDSTTEPVALNDVFKRVSPTSPRSSVAFSSIGDHLHMSPVAESSSHMCPSEKQGAATGFPTVHEAVNRGESPKNCSYMADASISVIAGAPSQNAGNDVSETVPSQCSGNQDIPSAREEDEWGEMVSPVEDTGEAVLEGALPPVSSRIEYWQDVGGENSMLSTRGSEIKRIGSPINDPAISLSKRDSYFFGFGRENVFANAISTDKPAGVACSPQLSNDESFRSNEDLIQRIVYGLPDLSYMEK